MRGYGVLTMVRKVFVSGCFDLLHSGHVAFLKTAAEFGDVYVGVGRDESIELLKRKTPVNTETERLFMVRSVRYVKEAWLNSGVGLLDFAEDLERFRPDIFVVNEDGHAPEKAALCARIGAEYHVLKREPEPSLPVRYSSMLRTSEAFQMANAIPYRAEICGGWLDQPMINRQQPGYVVCAQLMPHPAYAQQPGGGLATSTRTFLEELKNAGLGRMEDEELARLVFRYENGIDRSKDAVSGAQDAIGLCVGGISFQYYENGYWPQRIERVTDEETLCWLEDHLSLYPLHSRQLGYDPLEGFQAQPRELETLAESAALCVQAIKERNLDALSESMNACRKAQTAIFPAMLPDHVRSEIAQLEAEFHLGSWKFTGAGGGGWLLLLGAQRLPGAVPLKISVCNPLGKDV